LFIVADDLGWNDVGYHDSIIKTPTIDSLAAEGIILENFYSNPQCTPSRISLLSGRYPIYLGMQHHVLHNGQAYGMDLRVKTLGDIMKDDGYSTHYIGKWQLAVQLGVNTNRTRI